MHGTEVVASVDGIGTELLLNTEKLVVLSETVGAARSTGLDLASGETNNEVGDEAILGLTGAVRNHNAPSGLMAHDGGLDGLRERTDLVDLHMSV